MARSSSTFSAFFTWTTFASSLCHSYQLVVPRRRPSPCYRCLCFRAVNMIRRSDQRRHHGLAFGGRWLERRYTTSFSMRETAIAYSRTEQEIQMTTDALAVVQQAIHAVNPSVAVKRHVRVVPNSMGLLQIGELPSVTNEKDKFMQTYNVQDYDNVMILAFGKASSAMAAACIEQLKEQDDQWAKLPISGYVIVKDDHGTKEEYEVLIKSGVHVEPASHPVPDERSVQCARTIMQLARETATERSLVLCCISGGGSSLFCDPLPPLTLQELQLTNSILLASGLSINDMNVIRKRLETGKGGKLAAALYPATLVTLVLSDILGDPLDLIASGPTVPDSSTPRDAWHLIQTNPILRDELPSNVLHIIERQVQDRGDPLDKSHNIFAKTSTVLVGNNELAVLAAADEASKRGYNSVILGTRIEGEARHVAGVYAAMAQHIGGAYSMVPRPVALIAGGETTVTLPPNHFGKGGRNQELALAAALRFDNLGLRNVVLASVGTDGTDGPTDAAGAVVDGATIHRLPGSAEKALQEHNAYPYLKQSEVGHDAHCPLIITGPTGTNVADVCVLLIR